MRKNITIIPRIVLKTFRFKYLGLFLVGYVLISIISCRTVLSNSPIMLSLLGIPLMIILPFAWGIGTISIINQGERIKKIICSQAANIMFSWLIGLYELVLVAAIAQYFSLRSILSNFPWIVVTIALFMLIYVQIKKYQLIVLKISVDNFISIILTVAFGLTLLFKINYYRPVPDIGIAVDIPAFIVQPVKRLVNNGFLHMEMRIPDIILVAIVYGLCGANPLYVAYFGLYMLVAILAATTYTFIRDITNDKNAAIIASLFVFLVNAGSSKALQNGYFVNTPFYAFHSNVLLFSLLPSLFLILHKLHEESNLQRTSLALMLMLFSQIVTLILLFSERFGDYAINWVRGTKAVSYTHLTLPTTERV